MNALAYIIDILGGEIKNTFDKVDKDILTRITEIRIRKNNFLIVVIKNTSMFLCESGELSEYPSPECLKTGKEYVDKLFLRICEYSIYSNSDSIRQGFVTLKNGARVGLSGTAIMTAGKMTGMKDISSLSFRIPNEISGCSAGVLNFLYVNAFPSVIIAGMPGSGKTTLLRDMAASLSSGFNDRYRKIAVIDERNEIAGKCSGDNTLSVGINTDVLSSVPKALGIELATRTLSPEMIICDEVSNENEVRAISAAFSSGVSFALSVHIGTRDDLYKKRIIRQLLETGEFSYIVLQKGLTYETEILDCEEVYREICRNNSGNCVHERSRNYNLG